MQQGDGSRVHQAVARRAGLVSERIDTLLGNRRHRPGFFTVAGILNGFGVVRQWNGPLWLIDAKRSLVVAAFNTKVSETDLIRASGDLLN